jgi:hypothetical protein
MRVAAKRRLGRAEWPYAEREGSLLRASIVKDQSGSPSWAARNQPSRTAGPISTRFSAAELGRTKNEGPVQKEPGELTCQGSDCVGKRGEPVRGVACG